MAFDRSALGWKNLFVMQNGKRVSMGIDRLSDDQIHTALGRADNAGALAGGWNRNAQGVVSRTPVAAPTPVPVPQAPNPQPTAPAPVQRPIGAPPVPKPDAGPWRDANGNVPAPIKDPDTVRVYKKINGKWVIQTVKTSTLTLQQLNQALRSPLNKGALKAANPTNPAMGGTPAAPAPPQADPNTGYFFNPWSDTLWSKRNADGTIELHAAAPGEGTSMLQNADLIGQYRLPGGGAGNMFGNTDMRTATQFLNDGSAKAGLISKLAPTSASLARLNAGGPGNTRYDIDSRDYLDQWDDKKNQMYGQLAATGFGRSGMRLNAQASLAREKSQGLAQLDETVGSLAKQNLAAQQEEARRAWALNMLSQIMSDSMAKKNADTVEALS